MNLVKSLRSMVSMKNASRSMGMHLSGSLAVKFLTSSSLLQLLMARFYAFTVA